MHISKNKILICILVIIAISLCLICLFSLNNKEDRLTDEQISQLREQYPICGIIEPPNVSLNHNISLEDIIELSDSFVYGEVVGDYKTYFVNASTGKTEADKKRKEKGIEDTFEFYEYTLNVINDTEGKYQKGDVITISDNIIFKDYNPKLSDGMKVVVPVFEGKNVKHPTRRSYSVIGMYYVTNDGYAISAFSENKQAKKIHSGLKVEEILKQLEK